MSTCLSLSAHSIGMSGWTNQPGRERLFGSALRGFLPDLERGKPEEELPSAVLLQEGHAQSGDLSERGQVQEIPGFQLHSVGGERALFSHSL